MPSFLNRGKQILFYQQQQPQQQQPILNLMETQQYLTAEAVAALPPPGEAHNTNNFRFGSVGYRLFFTLVLVSI
jgi:hypothetical protein